MFFHAHLEPKRSITSVKVRAQAESIERKVSTCAHALVRDNSHKLALVYKRMIDTL